MNKFQSGISNVTKSRVDDDLCLPSNDIYDISFKHIDETVTKITFTIFDYIDVIQSKLLPMKAIVSNCIFWESFMLQTCIIFLLYYILTMGNLAHAKVFSI